MRLTALPGHPAERPRGDAGGAADGAAGPAGDRRHQRDLTALWNFSPSTVSTVLGALIDTGYVIARPRQGNDPIQYTLSGRSRIVAGLAYPSARDGTDDLRTSPEH